MPVQLIKSEALIEGAIRKKQILEHISSFEVFSTFVPAVDKITLVTRKGDELKTEWFVTIDGAPFTWLEIDSLHKDEFSMQFEAVSGDFDLWAGEWRISYAGYQKLTLTLSINYFLGIPIIEDIVGNTLQRKIQTFADDMLIAHCKKIAAMGIEERTYPRAIIEKDIDISVNGKTIQTKVCNISCGGMMVLLKNGTLPIDKDKKITFSFAGITIDGYCLIENYCNTARIMFVQFLTTQQLNAILSKWNTGISVTDKVVQIYDVLVLKESGFKQMYSVNYPPQLHLK
jgi:ribosome-associated toxin RatA of RatAB toxin-antitoxin module